MSRKAGRLQTSVELKGPLQTTDSSELLHNLPVFDPKRTVAHSPVH